MAGFLNIYNQRIDKTRTVQRIGKNGIHYEYVMPRLSNSMNWQVEAMDVKSKKSPTTKYKNGKKPGQYQPIGDKTYFNFYQLKKVQERGGMDDYLDMVIEILNKFYGRE